MKINWTNFFTSVAHISLLAGNAYLLHKNPSLGATFAPVFQAANAYIPTPSNPFDIETGKVINNISLPQTKVGDAKESTQTTTPTQQ